MLCSERIDLINSVADLKLDNQRLQEMNKALQLQMEHSEENLKEIQAENKVLNQQIKEYVVHYSYVRLRHAGACIYVQCSN